ncbi:MAG TPA: glycoside hydrolase family 3 N-terminal domain-containing protein [Candidatus Acidoferrales bacterium]|nr:glycoside hydrolase family 3 N-terminal domain-containing protein [Candidatus Acidoferrales bacterium]
MAANCVFPVVMSWIFGILTLLVFAGAVSGAPPQAGVEQRIAALLARMTLDEKIGQMSQSTSMATPLSESIKEGIRRGGWGSFLNAGSPADRAEAQRIARNESRLGIPLLFGRDVIHGYHTIFPIPLGQAASWDPELIQQAARTAATEASGEGIRWTFAPMLDVARDPRWGRIAESLGEDPYVDEILGAAMVRGFQGAGLDDPSSMASCAKHFVGYGAAEAGRDYNSAWIPEVLLRDVYLPPFRAALAAGAATIMTAFNTVNGVPATGNSFLLRQILREEWKFNGLVVTDYEAINEMVPHGYAATARDAAREAVRAGVEMEMVSTAFHDHLKSLVTEGEVPMKYIDDAVGNILRLKFRLGLFDERVAAPGTVTPMAQTHVTPESRALAQRLATESAVLLKNEGRLLPLAESVGSVAVIGPLADSPLDQMGTWVMDGRLEEVETPLGALRRMLGDARVLYAPGLKNSRDTGRDGFEAALAAARKAEVVLLFLGEEQILSGEARSRAFLNLPGAQEDLVNEIAKLGKPAVAVILAGRPLTFHQTAARLQAVLWAWHPGTMGGPAIADLLFGRAVPSGKLTVTFPRTVGQVPIYYAHLNTGRPAAANELGVPMGNPAEPTGYTSKYIDVDFTPEYPFGYGLSYTDFAYSNLRLSAPTALRDSGLSVSADVTNRGAREATEVVQFYVHPVAASVVQPVRVLKGFRRLLLKPGETQRVTFPIAAGDLAFHNRQMQLVTEPGRYRVWIAPDSVGGLESEFTLR